MNAPIRLFACLLAAAAGLGPAAPAQEHDPRNPYGFPGWQADFPVPLQLPPHVPGRFYDRSRRQALERIAANLQGNTSREVWQMAMQFWRRAPKDAVEPLIETMDRAYASTALADLVKNCVEAMGLMADERFDEALRRALEHPSTSVQQAAYLALATSGKADTVAMAYRWFPGMDGKGRAAWLKAARVRLGEAAIPLFRDLMQSPQIGVRDQVLQELMLMPPGQAVDALLPLWPSAIGEFKVIIAGIRHAAGDGVGTVALRDWLRGEDPGLAMLAIRQAARVGVGELREDVLRLSLHPSENVRKEVVNALVRLEGDDVADTLEVLAEPNEHWQIKAMALRELTRRGRPAAATALLEDIKTATGTRLQVLLDMLTASGDDRAVPVLAERFRKAPEGEGRPFLQALALSGSRAALPELLALFTGPEVRVGPADRPGGALTTLNYIPVILPNLRGAEAEMAAAWDSLPKDDLRRRGLYLHMLGGVAADRTDDAVRAVLVDRLRAILAARDEAPQLRVLALNLLTHHLTVDDAMALKQAMAAEAGPMQSLLSDYLWAYF